MREFTDTFLRNKAFTNLPRKFNVAITGCTEHCTHAESQDLALVPAIARIDGHDVHGFNVLVGGKMGSGGFQAARPLDVFVPAGGGGRRLAADHVHLSRSRIADGAQPRPAGVPDRRLGRRPIQARARAADRPAAAAGRPRCERIARHVDHLGVVKQKQAGLNSVGLVVPVGRITTDQLFELARIAETYGSGDIRVTTSQNVLEDVPCENLPEVLERIIPYVSNKRANRKPSNRCPV